MVHTARVGEAVAALAIATPTAIDLVTLAILHGSLNQAAPLSGPLLAASTLVLLILPAAAFVMPLPVVVLLMGAVVVALVAATVIAGYRRQSAG